MDQGQQVFFIPVLQGLEHIGFQNVQFFRYACESKIFQLFLIGIQNIQIHLDHGGGSRKHFIRDKGVRNRCRKLRIDGSKRKMCHSWSCPCPKKLTAEASVGRRDTEHTGGFWSCLYYKQGDFK